MRLSVQSRIFVSGCGYRCCGSCEVCEKLLKRSCLQRGRERSGKAVRHTRAEIRDTAVLQGFRARVRCVCVCVCDNCDLCVKSKKRAIWVGVVTPLSSWRASALGRGSALLLARLVRFFIRCLVRSSDRGLAG